uniref:G_PROTEIN_RECEP_F1_2 domain-containing protein n=1 Tax=Macrostomum lignano TaxID=282301 RepID=A0A1I8IGP3_9PLAT
NELRKLANIRDVADIKDVAVDVAGRVAGQFGERLAREKANQLVERLAEHLNSAIVDAGLDPIQAPEADVSFTAQVACLPLPGNARLHDGNVRGLASVRVHNAGNNKDGLSIRVEDNSKIFVKIALAIGPVTASVNGDASVSCCFGANPVFTLTCPPLVLRLSFNGDLAERQLTVTEFTLDDPPELNSEVGNLDGGSAASWIEPLAEKVSQMERERLIEAAKNKVVELAKSYIEDPQSIAELIFGPPWLGASLSLAANQSCPADPAACPLCYHTQKSWRPHQFRLYLATGVLSCIANLLVVMAVLHRGMRYSCHWYLVAMAISDSLHASCLAAITQLIGSGGVPLDSGAALCKALYYGYFLCKSVSNWTVVTLSAELCAALCRPFRRPRRGGLSDLRGGLLLSGAEFCALAAAASPRLVFVGAPNGETDRANMLCAIERRQEFLYYAIFETLALTYVLPVALNLLLSAYSVCRLLRGRRRGQLTRALMLAALASTMFNAPYATVLAATQLGLFDADGLFHLGLCLYYATSAWSCLGVFCNLTIFLTFYAAFRRSLVSLLTCQPRRRAEPR